MKIVRIFSDRIRYRIRLEGFISVRIRVRIFNIRYRIRIQILKSYIYDVDIRSYLIWHDWHYPYPNLNSTTNMKTNMILMISVRIRSVFISTNYCVFFHIYSGIKIKSMTKKGKYIMQLSPQVTTATVVVCNHYSRILRWSYIFETTLAAQQLVCTLLFSNTSDPSICFVISLISVMVFSILSVRVTGIDTRVHGQYQVRKQCWTASKDKEKQWKY